MLTPGTLASLWLLSCRPHSTEEIPSIGLTNHVGEAHVVPGVSFDGAETYTVLSVDQETLCVMSFDLTEIAASSSCPECTWAFELDVSNLEVLEGDWCDALPGAYTMGSLDQAGLGFVAEDGTMAWRDSRYDWTVAPDATGTWTGDSAEGDLAWDWNWSDHTFYYYE